MTKTSTVIFVVWVFIIISALWYGINGLEYSEGDPKWWNIFEYQWQIFGTVFVNLILLHWYLNRMLNSISR